jgi:hypothetical protein
VTVPSKPPTGGLLGRLLARPFVWRALLVLASVVAALFLFAVGLEVLERVRDSQWRSERARSLARDGVITRSSNPKLVWENKPQASNDRISINRWGFRDDDYPTAKPNDIVRVAFVGDSVTFAGDVDMPSLFVSRLGQRLQSLQCRRPIQAMNFSVGGYNTLQIEELIHGRVLAFAPDEVVYLFCMNDFDFEDASGQLFRFFRPPVSFAWDRLTRSRTTPDLAEYHLLHFAKNGDQVFRSVRRMSQELTARNIGFRVVLLPVFDLGASSFEKYPLGTMHSAISARLQQEGVSVTDLLSYFKACATLPPSMFARDVWHLNTLGHQFVAEALLESVAPMCTDGPPRSQQELCAKLRLLESATNAGEQGKLDAALSSGDRQRIDVGSSFLQLSRFWPVETGPKGPYAWSRDASTISVSGLRSGREYLLELEVLDAASRGTVTVEPKGGGPSQVVSIEQSIARLPGSLVADDAGVVSVGIRVQPWRPSDRGAKDTRELGIAISGVSLRVAR